MQEKPIGFEGEDFRMREPDIQLKPDSKMLHGRPERERTGKRYQRYKKESEANQKIREQAEFRKEHQLCHYCGKYGEFTNGEVWLCKGCGKVAKKFHAQPSNTPERVQKTGRNEPCFCGSGIKYKNCCLNRYNTNH